MPIEVVEEFRQRQHHEQGYRVEVHDANLNAVRCGYDKDSPDRKRPRFHRGPLQMLGWLVALFYNACADFAAELGPAWNPVFIRKGYPLVSTTYYILWSGIRIAANH